jgi:hypothetical protein
MDPYPLRGAELETIVFIILFTLTLVAGGLFFARRNLRLGRGDRRNATRMAICIGSLMMFWMALRAYFTGI